MENPLFWLVPVASIIALGLAWYFYAWMKKQDEGTETMRKIASHVRKGAMSYLRQQYKIVALVFLCLVVLFSIMAYGFGVQNKWVPVAFLTGGFFSGLAGYLGMKTATYASARTANAARSSLNSGLTVAFRSGAVMGLVVVGLGLLDISFWYILLNLVETGISGTAKLTMITTTMLTFGMGASTQALFARVGGGIYTKAADVGADLVGKVEAGIPEDDPRNPAAVADKVTRILCRRLSDTLVVGPYVGRIGVTVYVAVKSHHWDTSLVHLLYDGGKGRCLVGRHDYDVKAVVGKIPYIIYLPVVIVVGRAYLHKDILVEHCLTINLIVHFRAPVVLAAL